MLKRVVVWCVWCLLVACAVGADVYAQQRTIVFAQPASSPPFAYVDKDGLPRGLVIDYWNLWATRNNVKVQFIVGELHETLQMVSQGRAEVVGGILRSSQREAFLEFSEGFLDLKVCLYVPVGQAASNLQDIRMHVAIVRDHVAIDYVKDKYPFLRISTFDNYEDMFNALGNNDTYGFVSDFYTAKHYMTKTDSIGKYRVVRTLFTGRLTAAVRRGNNAMLTYINDGMKKIQRSEIEAICNVWIGENPAFPVWLPRLLVGGGFTALILGLIVYIFVLRVQLRAKTRVLKEAIERIRDRDETLELVVRSDRLTGLSNRLDVRDKFTCQQGLFKRYGRCFCIILCSIDEIKEGSVSCDQECMDLMLVEVSRRLKAAVRGQDIVGRWSVEEFILILPETNLEGGSHIAEKLRKTIAGHKFVYKGRKIAVTMTFGLSLYNTDMTIDDCIRQAGECLYIGKKSGSNMVVGFNT